MMAKEKYFKDENNSVWGFNADGSQDEVIGDNLISITFDEMMEIVNPPPTAQQLVAEEEKKKASLRYLADLEIAWRQDAVDTDIATEEEVSALIVWKKYRVLLMRVDTAAPVWPMQPEWQAI